MISDVCLFTRGGQYVAFLHQRSVVIFRAYFLPGRILRLPFPLVLKLVEVPGSWGNGQDFRHSLRHLLPSARAVVLSLSPTLAFYGRFF